MAGECPNHSRKPAWHRVAVVIDVDDQCENDDDR